MSGLRQDRGALNASFGMTPGGMLAYASGGNIMRNRHLIVVDRQGNVSDWSPERRAYEYGLAASPDGSRLVTQINNANAITELWISKRGEPTSRRVHSRPGADVLSHAWSADGRWLAFAQRSNSPSDGIYVTDADGIAEPRLIAKAPSPTAALIPSSWAADGTMLATMADSSRVSVWSLHATPGSDVPASPKSALEGPDVHSNARFSPDGRTVAYQTTETGAPEVYVTAWAGGAPSGEALMVSRGGGDMPQWSRDGKQLYFTSQGKLMSVAVAATPHLSATAPAVAWNVTALHVVPNTFGGALWDLLPDGRLVAVQQGEDEDALTQIRVALHFDEFVKQKLRAAK
jgi:dipeptidyl aminopeptidase/acylaminoacyl peptidase